MSFENAKAHLEKFNLGDRIKVLDESSATVELASKALNTEPDRIAKTLSFMVEDNPILIVASGNSRIDNSKYKAFFHKKCKMLSPDEVLNLIGHSIGGVCPFGIKEGVKVYLDNSLKKHETVFPAVGSSNSAVELRIEELEKTSDVLSWVDVCK